MPEMITKYPDVTLQVLRSAGARCGEGAPQQILKACSRERFCALPGGEVCVFGLDEVGKMTQVQKPELCGTALGLPADPSASAGLPGAATDGTLVAGAALPLLAVAFGLAAWRRSRRR
jgi:hypothetical protein